MAQVFRWDSHEKIWDYQYQLTCMLLQLLGQFSSLSSWQSNFHHIWQVCTTIWVLPALDFDIRNGVEVSGEVVLVHHCSSCSRPKKADSQVRDGEEVPQVLGSVQLTIK